MLTECIKAIIYGIVEGITEWLPVSSTGHLILLGDTLTLDAVNDLGEQYASMFEVVIQLAAVLAVLFSYKSCLLPRKENKKEVLTLWKKLTLATLPAAVIGLLADMLCERLFGSDLDTLLFTPQTVAAALIVYGILFIIVEKLTKSKSLDAELGYRSALAIGFFQALAIIPGTSRSGATVIGARCFGTSRRAAAEFSFFMALPTMLGASVIKAIGFFGYLSESGTGFPAVSALILIASFVTAFAVSLATIRFLISFAAEKGFAPFGVYRIILGIAVMLYSAFVKK